MTTYPNVPYQDYAEPKNGLAVAGLVISIIGWLTGSLLCPIGLILSLVALGRPGGRGTAIAGIVIGGLGTCLGAIAAIVVTALIAAGAVALFAVAESEKIQISTDMALIAVALEKERDDSGYLPASLSELGLDRHLLVDPWGDDYRYVLMDDAPGYDLISNGEDGEPGTDDDIALTRLDELWEHAGRVRVETSGGEDGGRVRITIGDSTILDITGSDEGGSVVVDLGGKRFRVSGEDETGSVEKIQQPDRNDGNDDDDDDNDEEDEEDEDSEED